MVGKDGKKEVATAAFEKMNKRQQLALLAAVGLKAGPNVSLVYAIDKFRRDKVREVLLYMLFLCLFTVSALVQRDVTDSHYYTQTVNTPVDGEIPLAALSGPFSRGAPVESSLVSKF